MVSERPHRRDEVYFFVKKADRMSASKNNMAPCEGIEPSPRSLRRYCFQDRLPSQPAYTAYGGHTEIRTQTSKIDY